MAQARPASSLTVKLRRPHVVWLCLLGAMTLGGGVLLLLDSRPTPRAHGYALAAAVPAAGAPAMDRVFETRVPLADGRWQKVVIHHSGSRYGSPDSLDAAHRARGLQGLGYHFVIGNGAGLADGGLFVSDRWLEQQPGAHAAGPDSARLNAHAIGICLVGDGDRRAFSERQLAQLALLLEALGQRFDLAEADVVLHRDLAETTSPGRLFPEAALRERLLRAGM